MGLSCRAAGLQVGMSKSAVERVKERLVRLYGPELVAPSGEYLRLSAAIEAAGGGLNVKTLQRMCREGRFPSLQAVEGAAFLIHKSDVSRLRKMAKKKRKPRKCKICGKEVPEGIGFRVYCSANHHRVAKRRMERVARRSKYAKPPTSWIGELQKALVDVKVRNDEEWLLPIEAREVSGVGKSTLIYLRSRGVLVSRPHAELVTVLGPVNTYPRSQILVLKEVYARCCGASGS